MIGLNPWVHRSGPVSSVELGAPVDLFSTQFVNRFRVASGPVLYIGKPLPLREGEHAVVVGWRRDGLLHACFVALPRRRAFFRPYSAVPGFIQGIVLLCLAGLVLAKVAVLLGLVLAGCAAALIFHAASWVEGERLARQLARR